MNKKMIESFDDPDFLDDLNNISKIEKSQNKSVGVSMISKVVSEMQSEMKKPLYSDVDLKKFFDSICDGTFKNKKNVVKEVYHGTEEEIEDLITNMENL